MKYSHLVEPIIKIAQEAGHIIMDVYNGQIEVEIKEDSSPVTQADIQANDYIVRELGKIAPEILLISEEGSKDFDISDGKAFFLIDPLDGTKSFIAKTGEFTVNIAIIENNQPVFGVVYLPVSKETYFTAKDGHAYKEHDDIAENISVRKIPETGAVIVASKSHMTQETKDYIKDINVAKFISAASSLKFCLIAEGKADIYPRFAPTMEWDTAAAHAVLLAAGGILTKTDGSSFFYGKPDFRNEYFIAKGA